MKIVTPVMITPARIEDSNIPLLSDGHPEWDEATTYERGDKVVVLTHNGEQVNSIFEYVSASPSSGTHPLEDESPPLWLNMGLINKYRAFDRIIGTQTTGEWPIDWSIYGEGSGDGICYHLRPLVFSDTVSFFNINASQVNVVVKLEGETIYNEKVLLIAPQQESNWFSYFYSPLDRESSKLLTNVPIHPQADLYIAAVEDSGVGEPSIGEIVVGRGREFGATRFGTSISSIDFSRKERDIFGNFQVIERGFADTIDIDVSLPNDEITAFNQTLKTLRATPTLWIGGECYPDTVVYGYLRDYEVVISGPSRSDVSVSIEGLV